MPARYPEGRTGPARDAYAAARVSEQLAHASTRQIDDGPREVAHEFDAFVAAVSQGGEVAADFLESRWDLPYHAFDEAEIIDRDEAYRHSREQDGGDEWRPSSSSISLESEGAHAAREPEPLPGNAGALGTVVHRASGRIPFETRAGCAAVRRSALNGEACDRLCDGLAHAMPFLDVAVPLWDLARLTAP